MRMLTSQGCRKCDAIQTQGQSPDSDCRLLPVSAEPGLLFCNYRNPKPLITFAKLLSSVYQQNVSACMKDPSLVDKTFLCGVAVSVYQNSG